MLAVALDNGSEGPKPTGAMLTLLVVGLITCDDKARWPPLMWQMQSTVNEAVGAVLRPQ